MNTNTKKNIEYLVKMELLKIRDYFCIQKNPEYDLNLSQNVITSLFNQVLP